MKIISASLKGIPVRSSIFVPDVYPELTYDGEPHLYAGQPMIIRIDDTILMSEANMLMFADFLDNKLYGGGGKATTR